MTCVAVSALIGALVLGAGDPTPTPTAARAKPGPSFCAEWIRQTKEGYERLTLFADRTLVWKTSHPGGDDVRRKTIAADEVDFYCRYFAREEFWALPADVRSGLTGDYFAESRVTLTRPNGSRKAIRFDELSSFSPEASTLKASLQGLRNLFTERLAPATRFTPQTLTPGTVLRRFDGVAFRVVRVVVEKEVVELEGVRDPITYYLRLSEMRFQFVPPE
jgi:hypothetical protein